MKLKLNFILTLLICIWLIDCGNSNSNQDKVQSNKSSDMKQNQEEPEKNLKLPKKPDSKIENILSTLEEKLKETVLYNEDEIKLIQEVIGINKSDADPIYKYKAKVLLFKMINKNEVPFNSEKYLSDLIKIAKETIADLTHEEKIAQIGYDSKLASKSKVKNKDKKEIINKSKLVIDEVFSTNQNNDKIKQLVSSLSTNTIIDKRITEYLIEKQLQKMTPEIANVSNNEKMELVKYLANLGSNVFLTHKAKFNIGKSLSILVDQNWQIELKVLFVQFKKGRNLERSPHFLKKIQNKYNNYTWINLNHGFTGFRPPYYVDISFYKKLNNRCYDKNWLRYRISNCMVRGFNMSCSLALKNKKKLIRSKLLKTSTPRSVSYKVMTYGNAPVTDPGPSSSDVDKATYSQVDDPFNNFTLIKDEDFVKLSEEELEKARLENVTINQALEKRISKKTVTKKRSKKRRKRKRGRRRRKRR